jgi:hypothetical protein
MMKKMECLSIWFIIAIIRVQRAYNVFKINKLMYKDSTEWILDTHKCCKCGRMMKDTNTKYVNIVQLPYAATWKYPVMGNVITGQSGLACAVICDECQKDPEPVKYAMEYLELVGEGGADSIVYHIITELEPVTIIKR